MSTHLVPVGVDLARLNNLLPVALRNSDGFQNPDNSHSFIAGKSLLVFDVDLTVTEQNILADLFTVCKSAIGWTPSDLSASIKSDISTLKNYVTDASLTTYLGLASPNLAQTASALKLTIQALRANLRVLNAILRQ